MLNSHYMNFIKGCLQFDSARLSSPPVPPPLILSPSSDLQYSLPVQVQDHALGVKDNLPQSDIGREYYLQNMEEEVGHVMVAMEIIVLLCLNCYRFLNKNQ